MPDPRRQGHLPEPVGAREPLDGDAHVGTSLKAIEEVAYARFPQLGPSAASSSRARCRAASSRCSRWRGRWPPNPALLLLDELSMGLAPIVVEQLYEIVAQSRQGRRLDPGRRAVCACRARHRRLGGDHGARPHLELRDAGRDGSRVVDRIPGRMRDADMMSRIDRPRRAVQGRDRRDEAEDRARAHRRTCCRSLGVVLMVGGIVLAFGAYAASLNVTATPGRTSTCSTRTRTYRSRSRGSAISVVRRVRVPALLAGAVPALLVAAPDLRAARRDRRSGARSRG